MNEAPLSQHSLKSVVRRIFIVLIFNAVALWLMSIFLDDFDLGSFYNALTVSAVLGLMNALLWPFIAKIMLPVTVLTLGLGSLVINGIFVVYATQIVQGNSALYLKDWKTGIVVALGISIINSLFTRLLSIDDDDFFYRNVVKRQASRQKYRSTDKSNRTGIVFLEIDGLAHEILERAITNGKVPNIANWLKTGSHKLMRWECDWSSQTGAMQAGILHGSNWDMPAFRWYEKDNDKAMISNRPDDATEIERRHSNGKGLLHYDGASRANLVSGDAAHSLLTMSTVKSLKRNGSLGQDYMAFFANPYSALRTLAMVIGEIVREIYQQLLQSYKDEKPRVHRGLFPYPLLRSFTNVLQRELGMSATLQDIYAGRPVIYSMFLGYDEVAHHSGIERKETILELTKLDKTFGRLKHAIVDAPRKYELVILSDHGQTQGATFKQRYGLSLDEFVREHTNVKISKSYAIDEGQGYVAATSLELRDKGGFLKHLSKIFKSKSEELESNEAEVIVMPSGGLGLVSFINEKKRLSFEKINSKFPGLISKLSEHKGIGFVLVRSEKNGDMAIGKEGTHYLRTGKIKGKDPLMPFGLNAAKHVARSSSFPHCPDLMINAAYWQKSKETAAFEELVGSHGAMGGSQQYPFILYPSSFKTPKKEIVGAENVHKQFKNWLVDLGWNSYKSKEK